MGSTFAALDGCLSLTGLSLLWIMYFAYVRLFAELFRDQLLYLRTELAEAVASGRVYAGDPGHVALRRLIDCYTEDACEISLIFLVTHASLRPKARNAGRVAAAIRASRNRAQVESIHRRIHLHLASYLSRRFIINPFAWPVLVMGLAFQAYSRGRGAIIVRIYESECISDGHDALETLLVPGR